MGPDRMTQRVQKIAPTFNRLVVFSTTDTSYHGHPDPLESPIGTKRHALALYYYSNGRPEEGNRQRTAPLPSSIRGRLRPQKQLFRETPSMARFRPTCRLSMASEHSRALARRCQT